MQLTRILPPSETSVEKSRPYKIKLARPSPRLPDLGRAAARRSVAINSAHSCHSDWPVTSKASRSPAISGDRPDSATGHRITKLRGGAARISPKWHPGLASPQLIQQVCHAYRFTSIELRVEPV
jgi:hypothetical protein